VPLDCRDAARLAARWGRAIPSARTLPAAAVLDLFSAADALRRPARLEALLEASECETMSAPNAPAEFAPAPYLRAALKVVKGVDAGAIARASSAERTKDASRAVGESDAVTAAIRAARLAALRAWMRSRRR